MRRVQKTEVNVTISRRRQEAGSPAVFIGDNPLPEEHEGRDEFQFHEHTYAEEKRVQSSLGDQPFVMQRLHNQDQPVHGETELFFFLR